MLYKLGAQENLATDIKPIWGILEKWQLTRSAFSKLCIAFFLRKTSPYLNCIDLKWFEITKSNILKTTSGEWFPFSRAQHPTHRIIRIIYSNFIEFPSHFDKNWVPPNVMVSNLVIPIQVLQTWTGERWDWILSMLKKKQNDLPVPLQKIRDH